jgi:hypothetical protein
MTPAELKRALRQELRGFPRDKVDEFLNTVLILSMAPAGEAALLRQREKLNALERVEKSAKAFLDSAAAMPLLDDGLVARDAVKFADTIHQTGRLHSLVETWCLEHEGEPTELDKLAQFLWLRFQEARIKINGAPEAGVAPEEYRQHFDTSEDEDPLVTARFQAIEAVQTFRDYLRREREALAAPRRGPRNADHRQVFTEMARAYWRILGERPKTTKGGTFYNLAVKIAGNPKADPSRAVNQAIAALGRPRK